MNTRLAINSIYRATEGEGHWLGSPQVFVRFQGCAIGCVNCDSKETWDFPLQGTLTMEQTLSNIQSEALGKIKRVSITGGDPLHPKNEEGVLALIKELKLRNYWINIEAAGTRIVPTIFDLIDFISFDYKTPSTQVKVNEKLFHKLVEQYSGKFQIKAVIETREDFDDVLNFRETHFGEGHNFPWYLTPSYNLGEEFPMERFQSVVDWNEQSGGLFRVVGQQHKWMFGPDKKQV